MQEEGEETIRVLTVRGKEYRLPAEHATTLAQLKKHLAELAGIPQQQQEIIINGALCREPTTPLSIFGINPVYILAHKPTNRPINHGNAKNGWGEGKGPKKQACEHCLHKQRPAERFLSREEQAAYRKELEGSYSRDMVRQLCNVIAIDEQLAIRALRACCNNMTEAFEFVELQQRGQNYQDYQLDQLPPREPIHQQSYLQVYVIQQQIFRRLSRSKLDYTLFVASMKERSPLLYELLVRNRIFMEKLLFQDNHQDEINEGPPSLSRLPSSGNSAKTSIPNMRVKIFEQEKANFVTRLQQMTGIARQQGQWRLKLAGNNLSLAMEMLLDGNTDEYTVDWQKIPTFYKENLLTIFLQSPVWAPLKSRLKMMNPRSAFAWVQRRIVKHFPAILSLSDRLWQIYPFLLEVPYASIVPMDLIGTRPNIQLRPRSLNGLQEADRYYRGLVDKEIVGLLKMLGVEEKLAESATRAGRNFAFYACRFVRLGTIPVASVVWRPIEKNQLIEIDHYMRYYFKPSLQEPNEFHLEVAALAEYYPELYRIFLKYAGIYEAYGGLPHIQRKSSTFESERRNMKHLLLQMGDLDAFYSYGIKTRMIYSFQ